MAVEVKIDESEEAKKLRKLWGQIYSIGMSASVNSNGKIAEIQAKDGKVVVRDTKKDKSGNS